MALAAVVAEKFVIPEVMDIIKRKQDANNGTVPTVEEVQADFRKTVNEGITNGTDWLSKHPG